MTTIHVLGPGKCFGRLLDVMESGVDGGVMVSFSFDAEMPKKMNY